MTTIYTDADADLTALEGRTVAGDTVPNLERPDIVNSGITIVGKRAVIPAGLHIGRNVVIGPGVQDELIQAGHLASGASVHPTQMSAFLCVCGATALHGR